MTALARGFDGYAMLLQGFRNSKPGLKCFRVVIIGHYNGGFDFAQQIGEILRRFLEWFWQGFSLSCFWVSPCAALPVALKENRTNFLCEGHSLHTFSRMKNPVFLWVFSGKLPGVVSVPSFGRFPILYGKSGQFSTVQRRISATCPQQQSRHFALIALIGVIIKWRHLLCSFLPNIPETNGH